MKKYLDEALSFAKLEKLPAEGKTPFEGNAIANVILADNTDAYIIAGYNKENNTLVLKKTFHKGIYGYKEILNVYPYEVVFDEVDYYSQFSIRQLREMLDAKEIPYEKVFKKDELIALLKED